MTHAMLRSANIEWREDKLGNTVPFSLDFNDIYYSTANGLAESRYVFVDNNQLPKRFEALFERFKDNTLTPCQRTFTIAELGFGTGLNVLVTWQLWQQSKHNAIKSQYIPATLAPRLHFISTEKYPLSHADFARSLECWKVYEPALTPLIETLIRHYPSLVAGVHRIYLAPDVILDLWLGEAKDSLASLDTAHGRAHRAYVDAWYLDGFAPSCNDSLWARQIFDQIRRLSAPNTTVATFSCAGVVKRGLRDIGFVINKVKGFGYKREMLTAVLTEGSGLATDLSPQNHSPNPPQKVAVIGAGIAGLMSAWSLANRGIYVLLIDKSAPLAGASGNPRALLAPKMTPIHHASEHLHTISYLYSSRFYQQLDLTLLSDFSTCIFEHTGALDLLTKANVNSAQIAQYPDDMATTLCAHHAIDLIGLNPSTLSPSAYQDNVYLAQAGLVNPRLLAQAILKHPLIEFKHAHIKAININNAKLKNPKTHDPDTDTDADPPCPHHNAKRQVRLLYTDKPQHTGNPQHNNDSTPQPLDSSDANSDANSDVDSDVNTDADIDNGINTDAVIIASGYNSTQLDDRIFNFRKIRGQLSWFTVDNDNNDNNNNDARATTHTLPKVPLKYGGYCATFVPIKGDDNLNPVSINQTTFLLGASFVRNDSNTEIRASEHDSNRNKLIDAIGEFDTLLPKSTSKWQARVGIRAQTPDYHPLVGQVDEAGYIWTLSGMGSKGFAFAPLCAEVLADSMTGQFAPVSSAMLARLSPHRPRLQHPLK